MLPDKHNDQKTFSERDVLAYLSADRFMATMLHAESLSTAFKIGLVDCLISRGPASAEVLAQRLSATPRGLSFLMDILAESGVVEKSDGQYLISRAFMAVLPFRELVELKLSLANLAARDMLGGLTDLVMQPDQFMQNARFHRLFAYDQGFGDSEADRQTTARWMRITTLLTRYEAAVCMAHHDFSPYRNMLDVGGNSGEFALRLCRRWPDLRATVFDLPLVCEVGQAHVSEVPEAERISFFKGDARTDELPAGHDLITFKSMLHDWPDELANQFIGKAARALPSGGRILIFEREKIRDAEQASPYTVLPFLVFFHSYRSPETYAGFMEKAGFVDIDVQIVDLDMPFMIVTGRLP